MAHSLYLRTAATARKGWTHEFVAYLEHRLRLSGISVPLFEPGAVEALYQATHGLPRKVNRIAHYALSAAALAKAQQIDLKHIYRAVEGRCSEAQHHPHPYAAA